MPSGTAPVHSTPSNISAICIAIPLESKPDRAKAVASVSGNPEHFD
jgi:hypothetical protein